jgi:hypothetical protein
MRIVGFPAVAFAISLLASHANAGVIEDCATGCTVPVFDGSGFDYADYTIPVNVGLTYWNFRIVSDDPKATMSLDSPGEIFTVQTVFNTDGSTYEFADFYSPVKVVFEERHIFPDAVSYLVGGEGGGWNYCGLGTGYCFGVANIWGNGTKINVSSFAPVTVFFSESSPGVPEPASWALMLCGFIGLGGALRSHRQSRSCGTRSFSATLRKQSVAAR